MKNRSLSAFDTLFRESGPATALSVPEGPSFKYSQLHEYSLRISECLKFGAQARIATSLSNLPDFVVLLFAAAFQGMPVMPLNPALTSSQTRAVLDDGKATVMITEPDNLQSRAAAESLGLPCYAMKNSLDSLELLSGTEDKIDENLSRSKAGIAAGPSPGSIALLLQTSGTTGKPKWVPLTHHNLIASVEHIVGTYQLTPEDATLLVMPLFHVHGLVAGLLSTLASGGRVILPRKFSAHQFAGWMRDEKPTWYTAVPTIHQMVLLSTPDADNTLRGRLRFLRSCSSPLAAATMTQLEDQFDAPALQAYGMTEAAHQVASNPMPPGTRKPGSVGTGIGVEIAILDEAGNILPQGTTGEVAIRGENITAGYLDNPEANERTFVKGFLRTGDLGRLDSDSHLFLLARLKELINRGGEKIAPAEIDSVLLDAPGVSQAVAFGAPDAMYGEVVHAAVVANRPITAEELMRHCRERLPAFMTPVCIHLVETLPTSPSGKISRTALPAHLGLK